MRTAIAGLVAFLLAAPALAFAQQAQIVNVQQTEIKRIAGEVVQVREAYRIPRGASITIRGEAIRLQDLQPGQQIRVYYKETSEGRVIVLTPPASHREPPIVIDEGPAEVVVEPEPPTQSEAIPATLPATASPVPLIGALGLLLVALGATLSAFRRAS
jgi:hypothetical protein